MEKTLICAAAHNSGVRHRMTMLSKVKHFADSHEYQLTMLWGVSSGVSNCRFGELFSPIPGVTVVDVPDQQLQALTQAMKLHERLRIGGRSFNVFRPGQTPRGDLFSWDLRCSHALACLGKGVAQLVTPLPSAPLRIEAAAFAGRHRLGQRIGIRIRVEEVIEKTRKPRRILSELNAVARSVAAIPWYARVFVATDSEYLQQMIASHFPDTVYLPKRFEQQEETGRYVHRQDKNAMCTFLIEVECLCQCRKIINIGGFLNDQSVREKTISEPYDEVAKMYL